MLTELLMVAAATTGQVNTGADLVSMCAGPVMYMTPAEGTVFCAGYFDGAAMILQVAGAICVTGGTRRDLAKVVLEAAANNPEWMRMDAGELVYRALQEVYPCPRI